MKAAVLAALVVTLVVAAEGKRFVDMTYALNEETPLFPGRHNTFHVETEGETPGVGWVASKGFCISEHSSTHMDAPYHFDKNGWKLNSIPFDSFLDIPGVMIDVTSKVNTYDDKGKPKINSNYAVTREDILEWEQINGPIPQKSLVFLRTGWASKWGNKDEYLGIPEKDRVKEEKNATESAIDLANIQVNMNWPAFGADAAKFLVVERGILGAGIDTLSLDVGNTKTFPAHKEFLQRRVYVIENVANLHLLPATGFRAWAVPFKIDGGTGAPTRVFAQLPDLPSGNNNNYQPYPYQVHEASTTQ